MDITPLFFHDVLTSDNTEFITSSHIPTNYISIECLTNDIINFNLSESKLIIHEVSNEYIIDCYIPIGCTIIDTFKDVYFESTQSCIPNPSDLIKYNITPLIDTIILPTYSNTIDINMKDIYQNTINIDIFQYTFLIMGEMCYDSGENRNIYFFQEIVKHIIAYASSIHFAKISIQALYMKWIQILIYMHKVEQQPIIVRRLITYVNKCNVNMQYHIRYIGLYKKLNANITDFLSRYKPRHLSICKHLAIP
jgi:hypothetical protein